MRALLLAVGFLACASLVASAVVALPSTNATPELLTNGDFEDDTNGWNALGAAVAVVADPYVDGNSVAAVTLTASAAFVIQNVALQPGASYTLSARYLGGSPTVDELRFQVAWQSGKGNPWQDSSSTIFQPSVLGWQEAVAVLGPLPCDSIAERVQVEIIGSVGDGVFIDDITLKRTGEQPCATATASPSLTATVTETAPETATATPTATALASGTPTQTPSRTATPSGTPEPATTATPTATARVATATTTPLPGATPTPLPPPATATSVAPPQPTATDPPPPVVPAGNMLANAGFESAQDGEPVAWRKQGGLLSQVSDHRRSGGFAGAFYSSTTSTKWIYQSVGVTPLAWYEFEAFVLQDDPWVASAFLRVSWYASGDGSGSALATVDSLTVLENAAPDYRHATTGAVRAPPGANSAQARIVMRPQSEAGAVIYVDDAAFHGATPPPTPTVPTATPTAPPATPTVAATATRTPPPPASETPTEAPSETPDGATAPAPTPSHGLLVNGGFEAAVDGAPVGWRQHGGRLRQVAGNARSGGFAASLDSFTTSTKWAFQAIAIEPLRWYEFDAYVLLDDAAVEAAFLRLAWYTSEDGSGAAIWDADSTETLDSPSAGYRLLSTGPVQAPPDARSAQVRVLLRPRSAAYALLHIDDVTLREVDAPPLEPEAPTGGGSSGGSSGGSNGASGGGGSSSAVLGASAPALAGPIEPQPTPVIRRDALLEPASDAPDAGDGTNWPPLVLIATATAGIAALSWPTLRSAIRRAWRAVG